MSDEKPPPPPCDPLEDLLGRFDPTTLGHGLVATPPPAPAGTEAHEEEQPGGSTPPAEDAPLSDADIAEIAARLRALSPLAGDPGEADATP